MIYFDTEKQAYAQKETIVKFNKIYLTECTDDVYQELQDGKKLWNDNNEIIVNPNYEEQKQEEEKQARNAEIDSKIKELQEMALPEILQGNTANVKIYNDVIASLLENKS